MSTNACSTKPTNEQISNDVQAWIDLKHPVLQSTEEYTMRGLKGFSSTFNKAFQDNTWFHNEIRGSHPASHWIFNQPNPLSNELDADGEYSLRL